MPLVVLAALALVGGCVGLPDGFLWGDRFGAYLAPSLAVLPHAEASGARSGRDARVPDARATVVALAGIGAAYAVYGRTSEPCAERSPRRARALYRAAVRTSSASTSSTTRSIVRPLRRARRTVCLARRRPQIIDGAVNGVGGWSRCSGRLCGALQTGDVQHYALAMLARRDLRRSSRWLR